MLLVWLEQLQTRPSDRDGSLKIVSEASISGKGVFIMEKKLAQLQAKLEADTSFGEKLFSLETSEEVQNFLKEQGLEFSSEEINVLRDALLKVLEKGENGELSDESLEDVAGGIAATTAIAAVSATITAANFTHNVTRGRW